MFLKFVFLKEKHKKQNKKTNKKHKSGQCNLFLLYSKSWTGLQHPSKGWGQYIFIF